MPMPFRPKKLRSVEKSLSRTFSPKRSRSTERMSPMRSARPSATRRLSRPELSGEDLGVLVLGEHLAAARPDDLDEVVVHFLLDRAQPRHVLRLLRLERVEDHLGLAGRVDAALHPDLAHRVDEAEAGGDDADRADDRRRIDDDLVAGAGDHVAARRADVLDEDDDRLLLLLGERADALVDQVRLDRRAARRIDDERHRRARR